VYHCVGVHKADRPKTAFSTPFGLWQFKRLPFGLCNAPATYTRLVQMVLEGISYDEALQNLYDMCIHSKDLEGHYVSMKKVFDPYRRAGLKIHPSKCHLFQAEIEYLGHFISKAGVSSVPKNIQVVQNWPLPTNKTEARSFLVKVGYYCRFIKDYAAVAKPWIDIVGKDEDRAIKKAPVVATPAMVANYRQLKQALLTSPVLAYPQFDSKEPFILDTDWSGEANTIGGGLAEAFPPPPELPDLERLDNPDAPQGEGDGGWQVDADPDDAAGNDDINDNTYVIQGNGNSVLDVGQLDPAPDNAEQVGGNQEVLAGE
jgi:hypothetical protein